MAESFYRFCQRYIENRTKIYSFLAKNDTISNKMLSELLGVTRERSRQIAKKMCKEGILDRIGNGIYTVNREKLMLAMEEIGMNPNIVLNS